MENLKKLCLFFVDIYHQRKMLLGLAKNDFKAKFASSFLGIVWAFIQPMVTIFVFWFVFQVGFRNPPVSDVPFVVWITPSFLVWSFFSEALMGGTNCLIEYSYLVRKVNFRVSMIPLVKIISSALVHSVFILFIILLLLVNKVPVTIYALQVIYYFFCTCILLVGLCWFLSAIAPFLKDTANVVGVLLQIGVWATPVLWDPSDMSPMVQKLLKLNPMFYICRGYRDCFVDYTWFWERGFTNLYFWFVAITLFGVGAYVFQKLRPQFADVL